MSAAAVLGLLGLALADPVVDLEGPEVERQSVQFGDLLVKLKTALDEDLPSLRGTSVYFSSILRTSLRCKLLFRSILVLLWLRCFECIVSFSRQRSRLSLSIMMWSESSLRRNWS